MWIMVSNFRQRLSLVYHIVCISQIDRLLLKKALKISMQCLMCWLMHAIALISWQWAWSCQSAGAKFRTMKISSEGLDGNSAKFAPAKISHYMINYKRSRMCMQHDYRTFTSNNWSSSSKIFYFVPNFWKKYSTMREDYKRFRLQSVK